MDNDCLVVIYKITFSNQSYSKISEKQPVFRNKSGDSKKVVIVRKTLM